MELYEVQEFYTELIDKENKKIDSYLEKLYSAYESKRRAEKETLPLFIEMFSQKIKFFEDGIKEARLNIELFKMNSEMDESKLIKSLM